MRNIFIIGTATQYLNALELLYQMNLKGENIIIITSLDPKLTIEIRALAKNHKWYKTIELFNAKSNYGGITYLKILISTLFKLNQIKKKLNNFKSRLIIGNYNDFFCHYFIQKCNYIQLYLLDDGIVSLNTSLNRNIELQEKLSFISKLRKQNIKNLLTYYLLGLKNDYPQQVTFFSSYKLIKNIIDKFLLCDFSYIKSHVPKIVKEKSVYFIGQPLIENNIIRPDYFYDVIFDLIKYFKNYKFVYIIHRREEKENIFPISKMCEVKKFNKPLELAFNEMKFVPQIFASFYSSAILNLNQIHLNNFIYILIKLEKDFITPKYKESVSNVYKNIELEYKNYINVMNRNQIKKNYFYNSELAWSNLDKIKN